MVAIIEVLTMAKIFLRKRKTLSERVLIAANPVFVWVCDRFPSKFPKSDQDSPHPTAMIAEMNFLGRALLHRIASRIEFDADEIAKLKESAKDTTIVFVTTDLGHLEYLHFSRILADAGLPPVSFNNVITMRRWMRWMDLSRSITAQEREIEEHGHPLDPIENDYLYKMVADGKNILLRLLPSELTDDNLFFTGPIRELKSLIRAQTYSTKPVSIVPLTTLWRTSAETERRSIWDILFGDKEHPGSIRKFTIFCRNLKGSARATIGRPIDLKTFIDEHSSKSSDGIATELRNRLMSSLSAQRRTMTGPPLRPRSYFIQTVLADDTLDKAICEMATSTNRTADEIRELALSYIHEIAADTDHTYIELLDWLISRTFSKLFESISVDADGLARAKALYEKGPVVFVPNHRSHVDSLLLPHILFHHGMTVPHMTAGINLSFWPLGRIFRKCGAFFIRRSFRGNELYKLVLESYLRVLLREGYSQVFFIEGGRSRTGKLLKPKMGMLSMLSRSAKEAGVSGLTFLPVSITYDRVLEQKSYVSEQEGQEKQAERTRELFKFTKFLKRPQHKYGSIFIKFGDPITTGDDLSPHGMRTAADAICHEINRHTVVTPAAIAAASLLAPARAGISIVEFKKNATVLSSYLKHKGVEFSGPFDSFMSRATDEALTRLEGWRLISVKKDAPVPLATIDESKRVPLSFLKNTIAHYLISIGIVSRLIRKGVDTGIGVTAGDLYPDIIAARSILENEFRFSTRLSLEAHCDAIISYLRDTCIIAITGADGAISCTDPFALKLFSDQVGPYLESILITANYVEYRGEFRGLYEKDLIQKILDAGGDMLALDIIKYRESITKDGILAALRTLISFGLIESATTSSSGKKQMTYSSSITSTNMDKIKVILTKIL